MAIRYKDLKDPEVKSPLTEEELQYIDKIEKFIDEEIKQQWTSTEVKIFLGVAKFTYDPFQKQVIYRFNQFRRTKMFEELQSRFKKADWNCKIKIDNDGGMYSCDYWILTPKKV